MLTAQTTTFIVQVQERQGKKATKTLSIEIDPPQPLVITNSESELASGTVGKKYSASPFASGGCLPLVWSISSSECPPGLKLDNKLPVSIPGTPTTAGTFTFTVTVNDKAHTQTSEPGRMPISP